MRSDSTRTELPCGWSICSMKRLLKEPLKYGANESGGLSDPDCPRYIRITDFGGDGKLRDDTFASLPTEVAANYLLDTGDLLFARSGATVGKCYYYDGVGGPACFAGYLIKATTRPSKLDSRFLYHFTSSPLYSHWRDSSFVQATIENIGAQRYGYLPVPLPPLPEQKRIAAYLDASCAAIDRAVEVKQKQLETLDALRKSIIQRAVTQGLNPNVKLKEAGVAMYGLAPHHWTKGKLRYEIQIANGKFASDKITDDGEFPIYGGNGVMARSNEWNTEPPFIVIGRVGAYCGNAHYVDEKAWVSDNAMHVTTNHHPQYLAELFAALDFNSQANNTAQPVITGTKIKNTYVLLPPRAEQIEIYEFIREQRRVFSLINDNLSSQITTLTAYRKSLIHECVTGKRRINDADIEEVVNHV